MSEEQVRVVLNKWADRRLLDMLGVDLPIVQAPMAGASGSAMAAAVSTAGALGSLPCAMLDAAGIRAEVDALRQQTNRPFNLNFFCHTPAAADAEREASWRRRLSVYYADLGVDAPAATLRAGRTPFDEQMCALVEAIVPKVVSFHFGLPAPELVSRVTTAGCVVLGSATTVAEARWLEERGCNAVIAQGYEAGGHRGMFLSELLNEEVAMQPGTFALLPQVVDAVTVPVIAAGGIADGRGIAAAFALGAAGVQIGTAYLFTAEALISDLHRAALDSAQADHTTLTNVFSGRPARGIVNRLVREVGPMAPEAPAFPMAGGALAPLKAAAEAAGDTDFSALWSGQSANLAANASPDGLSSADLTRWLADDACRVLAELASGTSHDLD
jgi:nitronate monooxygenase